MRLYGTNAGRGMRHDGGITCFRAPSACRRKARPRRREEARIPPRWRRSTYFEASRSLSAQGMHSQKSTGCCTSSSATTMSAPLSTSEHSSSPSSTVSTWHTRQLRFSETYTRTRSPTWGLGAHADMHAIMPGNKGNPQPRAWKLVPERYEREGGGEGLAGREAKDHRVAAHSKRQPLLTLPT